MSLCEALASLAIEHAGRVAAMARRELPLGTRRVARGGAHIKTSARQVQPMGQIGRRKPKVRKRDDGGMPFDLPRREVSPQWGAYIEGGPVV